MSDDFVGGHEAYYEDDWYADDYYDDDFDDEQLMADQDTLMEDDFPWPSYLEDEADWFSQADYEDDFYMHDQYGQFDGLRDSHADSREKKQFQNKHADSARRTYRSHVLRERKLKQKKKGRRRKAIAVGEMAAIRQAELDQAWELEDHSLYLVERDLMEMDRIERELNL